MSAHPASARHEAKRITQRMNSPVKVHASNRRAPPDDAPLSGSRSQGGMPQLSPEDAHASREHVVCLKIATLAPSASLGGRNNSEREITRPSRRGTRRYGSRRSSGSSAMTNRVSGDLHAFPLSGDLRSGNTALLVIDMQHDFCSEGGYMHRLGAPLSGLRAPIEPIRRVLAAVRAAGYHVMH